MAINLDNNEIAFLYSEMVDNATLIKIFELTGLNKSVKERYSAIYQKHIASHKEIDWNCSSCAVESVTQIYNQTAPYADKVGEALAALKESEPTAKATKKAK